MNERIRELAEQADGVFIHKLMTGAKQYTFLEKDLEKFAQLIVLECANKVDSNLRDWLHGNSGGTMGDKILEHFDLAKNPACLCHTCRPISLSDPEGMMMRLCPECGNKRCPKATNHIHACTDSNDSGQEGSIY